MQAELEDPSQETKIIEYIIFLIARDPSIYNTNSSEYVSEFRDRKRKFRIISDFIMKNYSCFWSDKYLKLV